MVSPDKLKYLDWEWSYAGWNTVYIAVSGSHAYGWSKEDSDLDLRVVWFPYLKQALSLSFTNIRPREHQLKEEGKQPIDFVEMPIQSMIKLLYKGNGNSLENLFQEHIISDKEMVKELQDIVLNNIHQGFCKHYIGYAENMIKDLTIHNRLKAKGFEGLLLCIYRVLLTGLYLVEHKKVMYNLIDLNNHFRTNHIGSLLISYLNNEKYSERMKALGEIISTKEYFKEYDLPDHWGYRSYGDYNEWLYNLYVKRIKVN